MSNQSPGSSTIQIVCTVVLVTTLFGASQTPAQTVPLKDTAVENAVKQKDAAEEKSPASFIGRWITTFGEMRLTRSGKFVTGEYPGGTIKGAIFGNSFAFRYEDSAEKGQAKFELSADGASFVGRYLANGTNQWQKWDGRRALPKGYQGLWDTSFGMMRLTVKGNEVTGVYAFGGHESTIAGEIKNKRLVFRYNEPTLKGSAWFELSDDEESISGMYRPDGERDWLPWTGDREVAKIGEKWLVILEANWEQSLGEEQYAFAEMLERYFTMSIARHVNVRTRSFHDLADLKRFCSEVKYLPGPVVLLLSTHGTKNGLTVFDQTITADKLADSLRNTSNLELLHLSGCSMMSGSFPDEIQQRMPEGKAFPISGYKTNVAWDASALGDFTFLSMLLIHRMSPAAAVDQAIKLSPYLGDKRIPNTRFRPLGLSIKVPEKTASDLPKTNNRGRQNRRARQDLDSPLPN